MNYLLGIDVGTKNVKAAAYSMSGVQAALVLEQLRTVRPRPERSEFISVQIWESVCMCVRGVCDKVGGKNIKGVGVSSVAEQGIPMDRDGSPLHAIIAWYDMRCAPQFEEFLTRIDKRRVFDITGQIPSPKYGLAKLLWIKATYPEILERTAHWMSIEDYIIYKLTGEFATDYSIAARTLAFDVNGLCWSEEILRTAGIPASIFSRAHPGGTVVGEVTRHAAEETGLVKGTRIVTGGHDHACAAISVNIFEDGVFLDSMRTAESTMKATGDLVLNNDTYDNWISMYPHCGPKPYRALTSIQTCGAAIDWFLATLGRDIQLTAVQTGANKYDLAFEDAKLAASGIPGLHFLPFIRGMVENDNIKGSFIGIRDAHTSGDFIKAILEGLSYELELHIRRYEQIFAEPMSKLRIVGNASRTDYWMEIKSAVFGRMVEIPLNHEAATYGAAILAAIGIGSVQFGELARFYLPANVYYAKEDHERYKKGYAEYLILRGAIDALYKSGL